LRALAAENARLTQSLTDTNHNLEAYKSQYEHFYKLFELCLQRVLVLMSAVCCSVPSLHFSTSYKLVFLLG